MITEMLFHINICEILDLFDITDKDTVFKNITNGHISYHYMSFELMTNKLYGFMQRNKERLEKLR